MQDLFENAWHNVRGISEEELEGDPEVEQKYGDILETNWNGVRHHTQADMSVRAAQFSPFAALTGYDGEIQETARLTAKREELTEDRKRELDNNLAQLRARLQFVQDASSGQTSQHGEPDLGRESDPAALSPRIRITYFQEALLKDGGEYITLEASVRKLDDYTRRLVLWTRDLDILSNGHAAQALQEQRTEVQAQFPRMQDSQSSSILTISVNDIFSLTQADSSDLE